jgi:FAD/FMN-containing dehydrogenase
LIVKPTAGTTTAPVFTPREFVNWHRNVRRTLPTVRPTNLAELVAAVRQIQSRGEVAGVSGSGWSFTNCVVGTRTQSLIDTSALNATLGALVPDLIDDRTGDGRRLVHVEAGIKLYDLNCRLDALGLALPTLGGSRGQSLAGVLNTGVHGGDVALPPIADAVRAIHLVGPGGQQWWIEPAIGCVTSRRILERARARGILDPTLKNVYDDDWFNALLVAMGCAGVVYSVVVECRPAFRLRQTIVGESWSVAQRRIRDLSSRDRRPRFLEINVNPTDSSCRVTVRDETVEPDRAPPASSGPSIGAIALAVGLVGPGALGLFFGAIGDYIARTTAEITALGLVPFAGPALQVKKTAEALKPVTDAHRLLVELGLAAVDPNNPRRIADVLPTAINLIWAIGAFVVSGRTLVDALQRELTNQQRPDGIRVGKSFQIMTGQPPCTTSGVQNHDETDRLVESYEYAVATSRCIAFIDRLIAVVAEQRGGSDAIVVNLNLRFTGRTRATLGMSKFDSTCHVEIYTFRGLRGNDAFKRRLHEVVTEFDAIPHLGQLHLANEAAVFREIGALERWRTVLRAISGGNQMFWSTFAMERGFLP